MNELRPKSLFADRYRLRKRMGEGVLWEAWLADNEMAGYEQVVKIFAPVDEPGGRAFRREFARAYHLMHPRLLRATYFDISEDRPYLVMPYCRRGSARRLVGKLDEGEVARVMRDVGGALAYIHQPAYRLMHRDVQPDNIMLSDKGDYLLSDSGISPELREAFQQHAEREGLSLPDDAGMVPSAYRAPESFGEEGDELMASDIWALGATLYELAAGHPPFGQQGGKGQSFGQPTPSLPSTFSPGLSNILKHCLSKGPWGRPSAENLRLMAEGYLNSGQWPAQYFEDRDGGWKQGREAKIWKPLFKLAGFVLLAGIVAALGMLALPRVNNENNLAWNKAVEPETITNQTGAASLPTENHELDYAKLEPENVNSSIEEATEAVVAPVEAQPESSPPAPQLPQVARKTEPPAAPKAKEPAVESKKPAPRPAPAPGDTMEKEAPGKKTNDPKPAKEAKEQLPKPKFDKATGKWGYVDNTGMWIFYPQFEEAGPYQEGKAKVSKKGNDGELKSFYLFLNGGMAPIPEPDLVENQDN
ncbi:MAG: protein kinase [Lewinellaceae bacterium]|nr:protein kinase [Lewinellaceae bacterium]